MLAVSHEQLQQAGPSDLTTSLRAHCHILIKRATWAMGRTCSENVTIHGQERSSDSHPGRIETTSKSVSQKGRGMWSLTPGPLLCMQTGRARDEFTGGQVTGQRPSMAWAGCGACQASPSGGRSSSRRDARPAASRRFQTLLRLRWLSHGQAHRWPRS